MCVPVSSRSIRIVLRSGSLVWLWLFVGPLLLLGLLFGLCVCSLLGEAMLELADLAVRPELDCDDGPGIAAKPAVVRMSVSSSEKI